MEVAIVLLASLGVIALVVYMLAFRKKPVEPTSQFIDPNPPQE